MEPDRQLRGQQLLRRVNGDRVMRSVDQKCSAQSMGPWAVRRERAREADVSALSRSRHYCRPDGGSGDIGRETAGAEVGHEVMVMVGVVVILDIVVGAGERERPFGAQNKSISVLLRVQQARRREREKQ